MDMSRSQHVGLKEKEKGKDGIDAHDLHMYFEGPELELGTFSGQNVPAALPIDTNLTLTDSWNRSL